MANAVTIPILNGIVDLVYLENAVTMILADDPRLANTPVIPEFALQMTSDQTVDCLWTVPRTAFTVNPTGIVINTNATGPVGAGLLVEMPGARSNSPGVAGSPMTWDVNVLSYEERNINLTPGVGTMITSEQYAQLVVDILHLQYIFPYSTLQVAQAVINPAHDKMAKYPGITCNRTSLTATAGRHQSTRTAPAIPTVSGGNCTITCADGAAVVYYTLDGSMPVAANATTNQTPGTATLYAGPFAVASGTTVLCAARNAAASKTLSPVNGVQAP